MSRPALRFPAVLLLVAAVVAALIVLPDELDLPSPPTPDPPATAITSIVRDLPSPIGMTALPDGRLAVALGGTGQRDDSAGAVIVDPRGGATQLVTGLPSTFDSGDLAGANLIAVSPDESTLYLGNFLAGHLWTIPLVDGAPDPAELPYTVDTMGRTMEPFNQVQLLNPYSATFDPDGRIVVSDSTGNGLAVPTADGRTEFIHRFDPLTNPDAPTTTIDPVPTGIERVGDEYLVTLFGGCPYPDGAASLVAVSGDRDERTVADGLTMPIDVTTAPDGTVWVAEFARYDQDLDCFDPAGYLPGTGRVSQLDPDTGQLRPVIEDLDFPGALVVTDDAVFVTSVFTGEILRIDLAAPTGEPTADDADATATGGATPVGLGTDRDTGGLTDVTPASGIDARHGAFRDRVSMDPVAAMGAGLCWIDVDADGWLDLYLVNSHAEEEARRYEIGGGLPTNSLWRNHGDGTFGDISASSGTDLAVRGNGCVAADIDLDGHTDLFVTVDGVDVLLHNNGDGTFTDITEVAGLGGVDEWSTAAAVADVSGNGWPDLFVGAYLDLDVFIDEPLGTFPQDHPGLTNRLWLNDGPDAVDGIPRFREVALDAGLTDAERTLGAVFADLDGDGHLDLYIANDGEENRLHTWRALDGGAEADPRGLGFRFDDVTATAGVGDPFSGMGVAAGDLTDDGRSELFVTNWDTELNALYVNETNTSSDPRFRYATFDVGLAGLGRDSTGWGTSLVDLDNSGFLDLVLVNGHVPVTDLEADAQVARAYANRGADGAPGQLRELTNELGLMALGPLSARGSAMADWDNTGAMGMAIATVGGPPVLLRNDHADGNWLRVEVEQWSRGARVEARLDDGRTVTRTILVGSSYLASEDPRVHLGLGGATGVAQLEVVWSDGARATLEDIAANQAVRITRPA